MEKAVYIVEVNGGEGFIKETDGSITQNPFEAKFSKNEDYAIKIAFDFNKVNPDTTFKIVELTVDSEYIPFIFEDENDINSMFEADDYDTDF